MPRYRDELIRLIAVRWLSAIGEGRQIVERLRGCSGLALWRNAVAALVAVGAGAMLAAAILTAGLPR